MTAGLVDSQLAARPRRFLRSQVKDTRARGEVSDLFPEGWDGRKLLFILNNFYCPLFLQVMKGQKCALPF